MRNFSVLSDIEFERLCADLLQEELGLPVETFSAGADGGVDLRWRDSGQVCIGQCKHYSKSSFAQLLAAARKEVGKVERLGPRRYIFITSRSLTANQKHDIYKLFASWMDSASDVWSGEDIDGLLTRHQNVEMRHVKLWLSSGSELYWTVHSGLMNRSRALADRARDDMSYFVQTDSFHEAAAVLNENGACLIAGQPGVGKTMLAHALMVSAMQDGYQPIEISNDINDGWDALRSGDRQFFIYDDFLGQLAISERMGKSEDRRLLNFIQQISRSKLHKLVLTTREYILRDARQVYPALKELGSKVGGVVAMSAYSRLDRGRILYNHVWHSSLPSGMRSELAQGGWKKIVDHPNYNPRLVQYATGSLLQVRDSKYLDQFVSILENPRETWLGAYDGHLDEIQRSVLIVMCSFRVAPLSELLPAVESFAESSSVSWGRKVAKAIESLEQTFLNSNSISGEIYVSFHSPTVREFMLSILREDDLVLSRLIDSALEFRQLSNLAKAGVQDRSLVWARTAGLSQATEPLQIARLSELFLRATTRVIRFPENGSMNQALKFQRDVLELSKLPDVLHPEFGWWQAQLRVVCAQWSVGQGDPVVSLSILRFVDSVGFSDELRAEILDATLDLTKSISIDSDDGWAAVVEIYRDFATEEFPDSLSEEFHNFVLDEIETYGSKIGNLSELRAIAEDLDLSDTIDEIFAHQERVYEYEQIMEGEDYYYRSAASEPGGDGPALDAMFDRFG